MHDDDEMITQEINKLVDAIRSSFPDTHSIHLVYKDKESDYTFKELSSPS